MATASTDRAPPWLGRAVCAMLERDATLLAALGDEYPVATLYVLDVAMRGFMFRLAPFQMEAALERSAPLRTWLAWVREQDRALRRRIGVAQQRAADLLALRAAYGCGGLALVVGAGVSMAAGLPSWNQLVLEMIDRALYHGTDAHRAGLLRNFESGAQGGEAIGIVGDAGRLTDTAGFVELLAESLQPAAPDVRDRLQQARADLIDGDPAKRSNALRAAGEAVAKVLDARFSEEVRIRLFERTIYRTRVHQAIARLVRLPGAKRTPRVNPIITYNFDDLLETAIRESGAESTTMVSCGGTASEIRAGRPLGHPERASAVDIVHPHGLLPATRGAFFVLPVDEIDLVFSDSQYRARYGDGESWTKRVQLALFGTSPCLVIGSSLEDEDAIAQLRRAHRRHPGWFSYAVRRLPEAWRGRRDQLDGAVLDELGAAWHALGLRTIWVDDYDEIPALLDEVGNLASQPADAIAVRPPEAPLRVVDAPFDPAAAEILGAILAALGDAEGARRVFERAIATPGYAGVASAWRRLSILLHQSGDLQGAADALGKAARSGDQEIAPLAANDLGALCYQQGQFDLAADAYRIAIASGHPREASIARLNLGLLFEESGQQDDARLELQAALDTTGLTEEERAIAQRMLAR